LELTSCARHGEIKRSLRKHIMPTSTSLRLLGGALLFLAAQLAHAQYVWIDAKGTRQYADRPPPAGTPLHKILKAPGRLASAPVPEATAEPAKPAEQPKRAPTLAERETAYKERIRQRDEQERKEADEAARKRDLAARCEAARDARAQLDSGIRIRRFDASGDQGYMTDEEKAARTAQVNQVLKECR
jgi:type IV secretory pathway VirB10-like protein